MTYLGRKYIEILLAKIACAKYDQENKERLQIKTRERHQKLFKEEKEKKRQYVQERYKNFSKDKIQRLFEYRKNIIK